MSWAQQITFAGRKDAFEPLGPVSDYLDQTPWEDFSNIPLPQPWATYAARDSYPLPSAADREGYHGERHYEHWLSGLRDYGLIGARLSQHGAALSAGAAVLDFGCASGRVLRHFLSQSDGLQLWGCDINQRNVEWVRRFLAPSIRVFQNSVLPTLPLEDRSFDLIYAFSVFTHVDELELAWLLELRRLLKRGGVAYLSIHSDHTWSIMNPKLPIYRAILDLREALPELNLGEEMFARPLPSERFVIAAPTGLVYNVNTFHSTDYVRSTWGRFFKILDIYRQGSGYQDVVVLRKE